MGARSELVRSLAARAPVMARRVLELSANGVIPRAILQHWLSQAIARDVLDDRIRLYWRELAFDVPPASCAYYQSFEPATVRAFERLIRPGMIVADVGANIGYTAALAAQLVGPGGHVHAFEPSPRTLRLLQQNMATNGFDNVSIYPYVVGETARLRRFHVTESPLTDGVAAGAFAHTLSTIEAEERRLDDLLDGPLDFVKIDVEGAEVEVLRGMPALIAASPAMIVAAEWNPKAMKAAGHAPMELPEALQAAGFTTITVLDDERPGVERPLAGTIERFARGWRGFVNLIARRS
jgi:FkbM family methyltransferase